QAATLDNGPPVLTNGANVNNEAGWAGLEWPRTAHVGFYLLDAGRAGLEAAIGYRPGIGERLGRALMARPTVVYLGSIGLLALALILLCLGYAQRAGANLTIQ